MEQQFRKWLPNQITQQGNHFSEPQISNLIQDLNKTIPSWDEVETSNSLFEITSFDVINRLHQRCLNGADLRKLSRAVGNGRPSNALKRYAEFLQQVPEIEQNSLNNEATSNAINISLNQILYGPPGTGKTYSTVAKALDILNATLEQKESIKSIGALKEEFGSQVEFVTFHQSFSYEDFVEGLKADSDDDGNINYSVEDGVFKEICNNASSIAEGITNNISLEGKTIWKMSLGRANSKWAKIFFDEAKETNSLVLGYGDDYDFSECSNYQEIYERVKDGRESESEAVPVDRFKNKIKIGDIVIISDGNDKFKAVTEITGDYYFDKDSENPQKRKIKWLKILSHSKPTLDISEKNFTQATINKPQHIKKEELEKLLMVDSVKEKTQQKPHILIIDEINRGNISRIFGELITLIEPSKRAGEQEEIALQLPYSKKPFSVPNNVYIIGTMNTADRSLTMMDTALRRRFDFEEMLPNIKLVSKNCDGINLRKMLKTINQRIEVLYDREHTIGHAFLMKVLNLTDLRNAFKNKIIPLLEEYFYDDFEKIKLVLNDKDGNFYKKMEQDDSLFYNSELVIKKTIYKKQDVDLIEKDFFKAIYEN